MAGSNLLHEVNNYNQFCKDTRARVKKFEPYHLVWLLNHPTRSTEWLADSLRDDFHIHHIDGDHDNNAPENLVLIEACDHAMLHLAPSFRRRRLRHTSLNEAKSAKADKRVWRKIYKSPIGPVLNGRTYKRVNVIVERDLRRDDWAVLYSEPLRRHRPIQGEAHLF
jgi:hypothetical protein